MKQQEGKSPNKVQPFSLLRSCYWRCLWFLMYVCAYVAEALRNQDTTICLERSFEPPHDKTNKMTFAPSKESDQAGHLPSLNSLHCPHEDRLDPQLPFECTAKTLIRLGWSESLLGAHVILLVLSCHIWSNFGFVQFFIRLTLMTCFTKGVTSMPLLETCLWHSSGQ